MASPIQDWQDAFGNQVSLGTTNEADLPSHYPFSPERYRVFRDGTRQFVQYGSIAGFSDTDDAFELTPQSDGEVLTMQTTERFRYVVQYVTEWSGALQTNQSLQSGDAVIFGFGDADLHNSSDDTPGPAADGWFFIFNTQTADDEVTLAEYRDGIAVSERVATREKAMTDWVRYAAQTNWYNVGETEFVETFTEEVGNDQRNPSLGKVGNADGKGPADANKSLRLSVKSQHAPNLTAELGSLGIRTLGDVQGVVRTKTAQLSGLTVDTTGAFVPVAALRVNPADGLIATDLTTLLPTRYTGSGDLKLVAFACDATNTDASGFSTPAEWASANNAASLTESVTQMPDSTGTQTTNPANPGGYQLGFGSIQSTQGSRSGSAVGRLKKRLIAGRDILVFAAFVPSSGSTGDLTFEFTLEQDW